MPKTKKPKLARDRATVDANIIDYCRLMSNPQKNIPDQAERRAMEMTISHAQAWFAIFRNGEWYVGPAKFCGYEYTEPATQTYHEHRANMSGTESLTVLDQFKYENVGTTHPAWARLVALSQAADVSLRATTYLYVFEGEELPADERNTVEGLVTLIEKAQFSADALRYLVNSVERIAA